MGKLAAFVIIVIFLLLIVSGANEMMPNEPTKPTPVPVLARVGQAAIDAAEVPVCNAGLLLGIALVLGIISMYSWLSNDEG